MRGTTFPGALPPATHVQPLRGSTLKQSAGTLCGVRQSLLSNEVLKQLLVPVEPLVNLQFSLPPLLVAQMQVDLGQVIVGVGIVRF